MTPTSYIALALALIAVMQRVPASGLPPYWSLRHENAAGTVMKVMETRNMYQCQRLCWVTPQCASVSFSTTTRLCSLMSDVPGPSDVLPSRTDITSSATKSAATEWTSGCRLYTCAHGALCVSQKGEYMCLQHEITCPTPPSIDDADVNYSNTTFNSTATYSCHVGYNFQGSSEVNRCDEAGHWSGLSGECAAVSCGSPDPLANGEVAYSTVTYLSTAEYSCHVGYNLIGDNNATCDLSGIWTGFSGSCLIVFCGQPSPLDYATETHSGIAYSSTVSYTCNSGFNFLGSSDTATCGATGTWDGLHGECVGYCGPPVNLQNADIAYTLTVDGIANYTCDVGYIFQGPSNVATCGSNLQWSGLSGSCQVITCSTPVDVTDATRSFTTLTYGSTTTYTCDAGYDFTGSSSTSTCDETANWSGFQGSCVYVPVCPTPNPPQNAEVSYSSLRVGSVATYTCDVGYTFTGSSSVDTCLVSLSWVGLLGTCTVVTCAAPPTLPNSIRNTNGFTYGSTAVFTCFSGFKFTGFSNVATCDENGVWAGLIGTCDIIPLCPNPLPLANADVVYVLKTVNSVATYTCHVGYTFQGSSKETTCGPNLQWAGLSGVCQVITCVAPSPGPNSQISHTGLTYGSTATYICDVGYEFTGSSEQASCDVTRSWSGFSGSCTIISCGPPSGVTNADLDSTTLTFGSTVTYTCVNGHRFPDSTLTATATCGATGAWSATLPACHMVSCGVPDDLDNAVVRYASVTYGSHAEYNCKTGYEFSGPSDSARCNADEEWEGLSGSCEIVTCPDPHDVPHGEVDFNDLTFDSTAEYTCHDGFHFRGVGVSTTVTCKANGEWSALPSNCEYIRDCKDLYDADNSLQDGVYEINPQDDGLVEVYCEMTEGGWTVLQRRQDGSVDFHEKWGQYKRGFGDLEGEFWLGNEYLNRITTQRTYTLRVDLKAYSGNYYRADYSRFKVHDESEKYKLEVSGYSGTAGDSFAYFHNGMYFSATDKDNDKSWYYFCSSLYYGGWWYRNCHRANLNGLYGSTGYGKGLNWQSLGGFSYSMKYTAMKIRPT